MTSSYKATGHAAVRATPAGQVSNAGAWFLNELGGPSAPNAADRAAQAATAQITAEERARLIDEGYARGLADGEAKARSAAHAQVRDAIAALRVATDRDRAGDSRGEHRRARGRRRSADRRPRGQPRSRDRAEPRPTCSHRISNRSKFAYSRESHRSLRAHDGDRARRSRADRRRARRKLARRSECLARRLSRRRTRSNRRRSRRPGARARIPSHGPGRCFVIASRRALATCRGSRVSDA